MSNATINHVISIAKWIKTKQIPIYSYVETIVILSENVILLQPFLYYIDTKSV